MPDYNNGKIYKIINSENEVIYIGSTTEKLCSRYAKHKHKAIGNKIILLENCPCNSREELNKKEQELIEQYNNLLNKIRAYNTEEQHKEYRKEYHLNYNKEYYEENKKKLSEKNKVYYEENKKQAKVYYKVYREKFKDELSEKGKVKVICQCGCEISKRNISIHKKTTKHIKLMETK